MLLESAATLVAHADGSLAFWTYAAPWKSSPFIWGFHEPLSIAMPSDGGLVPPGLGDPWCRR
jgi:hypothetical protein